MFTTKFTTKFEMLPLRKYSASTDFSMMARPFVLQDNESGTQVIITVEKGHITIDELIKYRDYCREYPDKPNDWDALEPKAVNVYGFIVDDVALIDELISDPFALQTLRGFNPDDECQCTIDWFTELRDNVRGARQYISQCRKGG